MGWLGINNGSPNGERDVVGGVVLSSLSDLGYWMERRPGLERAGLLSGAPGSSRWSSSILLALLLLTVGAGCATNRTAHGPAYSVRAELRPEEHRIEAKATVVLDRGHIERRLFRPREAAFLMNPGLEVRRIIGDDGRERRFQVGYVTIPAEEEMPEHSLRLVRVMDPPVSPARLTVEYGGTLTQDVSAGEKEGEIHNFLMNAHIGREGVYLEPGGYWYPTLTRDGREAAPGLSQYELALHPVTGFEFIAGAEPRNEEPAAGRDADELKWVSPYPLDGLVLVGGPVERRERKVGDVDVRMFLRRSQDGEASAAYDETANLFLGAVEKYLELYEPRVGDYPMKTYSVVENFFSSGFAFPGFTLLSPEVIAMGSRSLRHGYLDHEMLHCWWGNGIHVDPDDGNWCEALASFGGNVYGFQLDGDAAGLRAKRRDAANQVSQLKPEHDKPLSTFGQPEGCGRTIAYTKGAAVFDMLAREVGDEIFWAAMRRFSSQYVGKYADWSDIQDMVEEESGRNLNGFFTQWVHGSGHPQVHPTKAIYDPGSQILAIEIEQKKPFFEASLPLRIIGDGSPLDTEVRLTGPASRIEVKTSKQPSVVLVDPDFLLLRKLGPAEIMPTSALTMRSKQLTIVRTAGEDWAGYEKVAANFSRDDEPEAGVDVRHVTADSLNAEDLQGRSVLVLGSAVRDAKVQKLIKRSRWPGSFSSDGFEIDGRSFNGPGDAVYGTVHHPDDAAQGLTVYYGNSKESLGNAGLLSFYGNSLLVFSTGADSHGRAEVVVRRDLETVLEIAVQTVR